MPVTTLTLHHILPYLPFGLEGIILYTDTDTEKCTLALKDGKNNQCDLNSWLNGTYPIKPLLYRLDDYRDINSPGMNDLGTDIPIMIEISELACKHKGIHSCSYAAIQAMAEAHIDMFSLIPAGLAVKKEPLK